MQIVSKWHRLPPTRRVERIEAGAQTRTAHNSDGSAKQENLQSAHPFGFNECGLDSHTIIAAQVIATRMADVIDFAEASSNRIAGSAAYNAALARKVHQMDTGSFFQEAI